MKGKLILGILSFFSAVLLAQTSGQEMQTAINVRENARETSLIKNYPIRNVGPIVQGGRVTDIAVHPERHETYYVAYASAGIYKTVNGGVTFLPVFDNVGALTIGDMAISSSNPDVLYAGTGEKNSSRSSYAGSGVYKTEDAGETWSYTGLTNSQHISKIQIHPENPDVVYVAVIGNLYTKNKERGIFKTSDGGDTWDKILFVNDSTGFIDLVMHPDNPEVLWASAWERSRKAWDFKEGGPGSAIYKTTDGGKNWKQLNEGLPQHDQVGRIGLDVHRANPDIVYAIIDNQAEMEEEEKDIPKDSLVLSRFVDMKEKELLKLDNDKLNEFLRANDFPKKYTAERVKKDIEKGNYDPEDIANYFGDANEALFNTQIAGSQVYRSDNGGESWRKTHDFTLDGVYFTYGYYFGEIRVSPENQNEIYVLGVPFLKSESAGEIFHRADTFGDVHADHHALWIDPDDDQHLLLGNDGGLYESFDGAAHWRHINNTSVGQFYTVNIDYQEPYHIYGGLQDNGTLEGSSRSVPNETREWEFVFGGDGMFVNPDPRDADRVYAGFQFGNYYRINRASGNYNYISPRHDIGEPALRYNWRTPLIMSQHNYDILYVGAQKIYRSVNRGDDWTAISSDLTKDRPQGNVPFSTITVIEESPLDYGRLFVGTDDGNVWKTTNDGGNWDKITGLPSLWVSSIASSSHDTDKLYVTLTGYRHDNFSTHVYKSADGGKNWTSIKGEIINEPANIIIEDLKVPGLLYLGTDHGTYVSMDDGGSWELLSRLPNVATYDMVIHPRENEWVIATHGRSIYVAELEDLQTVASHPDSTLFAFNEVTARYSDRWGEKRFAYSEPYTPEVTIRYFAKDGPLSLEVKKDQNTLYQDKWDAEKGFGSYTWDLKLADGTFISKGSHQVILTQAGKETSTTLTVK